MTTLLDAAQKLTAIQGWIVVASNAAYCEGDTVPMCNDARNTLVVTLRVIGPSNWAEFLTQAATWERLFPAYGEDPKPYRNYYRMVACD